MTDLIFGDRVTHLNGQTSQSTRVLFLFLGMINAGQVYLSSPKVLDVSHKKKALSN